MQTFRTLLALSLLTACAPKGADTDGDGSSGAGTGGAESTSTGATDPTTGVTTSDNPTTGVEPTVATTQTASSASDDTGPGVTTTAGTTISTTADPTATDGDTEGADLPGACAAVCAHWDECKPGIVGPVAQCTAGCIEDGGSPECTAAIAAEWSCVAGLSCEEALKFIESAPTSCLAEISAADEICSDEGACSGEIGGGATSCEFEQECNGPKRAIVCDADTCSCSVNGMPGQDCPVADLCQLDGAALADAITACCGFEWE